MQLLIKKGIVAFLLITLSNNIFSQEIVSFSYPGAGQTDTSVHNALLVLMDGGHGFIRVVSTNRSNSRNDIIEWQLQEEIYQVDSELKISDTIVFNAVDSRRVYGFSKEAILNFKILLVKDTSSGRLIPLEVTSTQIEKANSNNRFSIGNAYKHISIDSMENDLVKMYFKPYDDFYKNFFSRTRSMVALSAGGRMHLIIVANTNDKSIGASCEKDKNEYKEYFGAVAKFLGIPISATEIAGSNYSRKAVEQALNGLRPASNDIVIFYYSGHGFRKGNDGRRFPYIDLRANPSQSFYEESMQMEDIYNIVKRKGARLNLILSDCCNEAVTASPAVGSPLSRTRSIRKWSDQNMRSLFMSSTKTSIIATAADRDQRSSSNNSFGGFFSYYFRTTLDNSLGLFSRNVTWDKVLSSAKSSTIYKANHTYCSKPYVSANICDQTPVFYIYD